MSSFSSSLRDAVRVVAFLPRAFRAMVSGAPLPDTVLLFFRLVSTSVPVVFVVVFFCGAMLTVQAASSLEAFGGASMAGMVVGFGGIREVFPLLAAASIAARSGAEFASEIGTMRTTQQIDAIEAMGLDPMRLLVAPRIIAAVLGTPLCVLVACGAGMLGSLVIGHYQLGIDRGSMWTSLWSSIVVGDLTVATLKGTVLGFLMASVSTREGLATVGGAAGVGRAANRAVIRSMVMVSTASLIISAAVYGRFT